MEINKDFLTQVLENEQYEKILENNLHSGTHYSMVFPMDDKLYKAYYIEGTHGKPRWLSTQNSNVAECTEVKRVEETRVMVGYQDIDVEEEPDATPPTLDYYL